MTIRVAVYARYSTDKQKATSIEDQIRLCREYAARQHRLDDCRALCRPCDSGASLLSRPKMQALLRDGKPGRFDVVLAEGLDRLSRDQEDTAAVYKRLKFQRIRLVTVAEGAIGPLHVGLKGTMNAMYLDDVAQKTQSTSRPGRERENRVAVGRMVIELTGRIRRGATR